MGLAKKLLNYRGEANLITRDPRKVSNRKLTNTTDTEKYYFYTAPIYAKNKPLSVKVTSVSVEGNPFSIGIADRALNINKVLEPNQVHTLTDTHKFQFVVIIVPANTSVVIESISIQSIETATNHHIEELTGDTLVIALRYPSTIRKSDPLQLHERVKAYQKAGISVSVIEVDQKYQNHSTSRVHDGVPIVTASFNDLRTLLQKKQFKALVIPVLDLPTIQVLDASNLSETRLLFLANLHMLLYRSYDELHRPYFTRRITPDAQAETELKELDIAIAKYGTHPQAEWIFPSLFLQKAAEKAHGITFKKSSITHFVTDGVTDKAYKQRSASLYKKIAIIRDFTNFNLNSLDIDVRTILSLSKEPFFGELQIDIYGDGDLNNIDLLLAPIKKFSNVTFYKGELSTKGRQKIYEEHGVILGANRFDANTSILYEAAANGLIPVTSSAPSSLDEFIGKHSEILSTTENSSKYATIIKKLIEDKTHASSLNDSIFKAANANIQAQNGFSNEVEILKTKAHASIYPYKKQDKKPLLTVVIPSYNVEPFLKNCVFSLVNQPLSHKIEVLIVNDGSKDRTAEIGRELEKLTMVDGVSIVRLIDKENGGHGSTINAGVREARGKYFRLLDGDDYFVTSNFVEFLEILEKEDSDIVLSDLVEDYAISATKIFKNYYSSIQPGQKNDLDVMNYLGYGFGEWGPLLSTTTCKTQLLKDANFAIDEHCFYVDMEYNFIIYSMASTITYYPITIYNYYLGRVGQSMSKESMKRNVLHHEKVTLRLIKELTDRRSQLSAEKEAYIINKLILPLTKVQYYITTEYYNDGKFFKSFDKQLKKYPEFYNHPEVAGNIIKAHRASSGNLVFADSAAKRLKRMVGR